MKIWTKTSTMSCLVALIATGCAREAREMPIIDTASFGVCGGGWQRPFDVDPIDFPFVSHCAALTNGTLHYIDASPSNVPSRGTVLAVHGNPTWSFVYRKVAALLVAAGYRFIAVDLYGFGFSDKPTLTAFNYLASSHAQVVDEFVTALDLSDYILLAQDWGGPVGLHSAVTQPQRVAGLVLVNTWAWAVEPIASEQTSPMHTVRDWGVENVVNAEYYASSRQTALRAARGLGFRNDPQNGEVFERIQAAYRGPFFSDSPPLAPLFANVTAPIDLFARSLVYDEQFLAQLSSSLDALIDKPIYLLFGDDTAFGPVKCDLGPSHFYDFDLPRVDWSDVRRLCPASFTCETDAPEPLRHDCLDSSGEPYWHVSETFQARWAPERIIGVWQDASAGHWLQETRADDVAEGVLAVGRWLEGQ